MLVDFSITHGRDGVLPRLRFYESSLLKGRLVFAEHVVPLPKDTVSLEECVVSPNGKLVAFLVNRDVHNPLIDLLVKLRLRVDVPTTPVRDLWICDDKGHNLRSIGHLEYPDASDESDAFSNPGSTEAVFGLGIPVRLDWLPDSSAVSFMVDSKLYTLSVD